MAISALFLIAGCVAVLESGVSVNSKKEGIRHAEIMREVNHIGGEVQGAKNVKGGSLASCSAAGEAMTGFTRDGHCVDQGDDDAGSHHICIKMPSDNNFCTVTGQPNWCAEEDSCHEDQSKKCPRVHWCVCQWAFARYLDAAGGCSSISELKCDAVNMAAFTAYTKSDDPTHKAALACIKQKCGISFLEEGSVTTTALPQ